MGPTPGVESVEERRYAPTENRSLPVPYSLYGIELSLLSEKKLHYVIIKLKFSTLHERNTLLLLSFYE
jgi:hypothetical protein